MGFKIKGIESRCVEIEPSSDSILDLVCEVMGIKRGWFLEDGNICEYDGYGNHSSKEIVRKATDVDKEKIKARAIIFGCLYRS